MFSLKLIARGTQEADATVVQFATPDDYSKSKERKNADVAQKFLLGRAILRALLFEITGESIWQVHTDDSGKPYVINKSGQGRYISISHSHDWIACALSTKGQIGIDIEYWKPRNFTAIAQYAFGPDERRAIEQGGDAAFYRIWTMREAKAKATGQGILSKINGEDDPAILSTENFWINDNWHFFYKIFENKYSLAVAVLQDDCSLQELKIDM